MGNSKVPGIFLILLVGFGCYMLVSHLLHDRGEPWLGRVFSAVTVGISVAYWSDWFQDRKKSRRLAK
jgi:hypothetical protein